MQQEPDLSRAFEVASVRPTQARRPGSDFVFLPGGRFTASNTPVLELIGAAYGVEDYRILGGPAWIKSDGFDIDARGGADATIDEIRVMLRALLADRFNLRVRRETREMPIYALVLARGDGRTGPRLQPASPAACVDRGPLPVGVRPGDLPSCGRLLGNPGRLNGRSVPLALLATRLSAAARRVVVDRTGLTGLFDVGVEWGMTEAEYAQLLQQLPPGITPPTLDPNRPSLSTALQEQLGLKLESSTGAIEIIAIEGIERPTEN